jgi:hypothetical protein
VSASFELAYQKALKAVGGDKNVGGYLKITKAGIESPWWESVRSNLKAWRKVPLWGTAKSGIKGSSAEVRELVDQISFSPELMIVASPHRAAKVLAWAKTLPGWREGFMVFEPGGEVRGGAYTKSGRDVKKRSFYGELIHKNLVTMKRTELDPRHVEAFMRVEHSTLDGLGDFPAAVRKAVKEYDTDNGVNIGEQLAQSYGL